MSEYSGIRGTRVKYLASDPTLNTSTEGQVWYNSTSGTLKSLVQIKAWSAGGNMGTARYAVAGSGTQTAGLAIGGFAGSNQNATEEYSGFSWSSGGNLGTARYAGASGGTQTASFYAAGSTYPPTVLQTATEEYDGSTWTAGGAVSTARHYAAGSGTIPQGLIFGGQAPGFSNATEEYNGTSWTAGGNLNTSRGALAGSGTQTATLGFGGATPTLTTATESYNGTSWTSVNSMNTARSELGGSGTQTHMIAIGGNGDLTATEEWDGSIWITSSATLAGGQRNAASTKSSATAAFIAGGSPGTKSDTEEYVSSIDAYSPSTLSAWASGANMPEANYAAGSCGAQTAFLYFAGTPLPAQTNATREYDGSNWTTTGNFTSSRGYLGGCGTQTAALGAGGFPPNTTASADYDGSTWTAGNSMSQQRMNTGSTFVGIQTAALLTGGDQFPSTPRSLSVCEEYDGTNYSSGGAYPVVIQNIAQGGTQTAGWAAGGLSDITPGTPNVVRTDTNHYNGTSWTAGGALPTATYRAGGAGTQTAGLFFSGTPDGTSNIATSFEYDGISWASSANMATARQSIGAGGVSSPSTAAIGAGGYITPGTTDVTEEFTGGSPITPTGAVASTLTTS